MPDSFLLVQAPDYVGLQSVNLPVKALGAVYDGRDPYATPLGVVFVMRESAGVRELYVPRGCRTEPDRLVYTHNLAEARYIIARNGFELAHVQMGAPPISEEAKNIL